MPSPTEIAPIVEACFNERDAQRLLALWTDDFRYEGPNIEFSGKDRMMAQEENLWIAFPDIQCEVTAFLASEDRVTLSTRMMGTHKGPLKLGTATIEPTNRHVDFTLSVHMTFRDGRIAGERVFYDTAGFMRQLGLL